MKKYLKIIVPITVIIGIALIFIMIFLGKESNNFKNEYEKLNGVRTEYGTYKTLNIADNNPIKYSNYDEILDIINKKTGIIYLGYPECPWCRNMLPSLLEVASDYKVDTIYYMNMHDERDNYEVKDNKLVYKKDSDGNEIKGNKGYFKLLKALDKYLDDYVVTSDNKEYKVGEKRIYVPTVIIVKDGKILDFHVGTVDSQKNAFDVLNKKQEDELYSIFEKSIVKMLNLTCQSNEAC